MRVLWRKHGFYRRAVVPTARPGFVPRVARMGGPIALVALLALAACADDPMPELASMPYTGSVLAPQFGGGVRDMADGGLRDLIDGAPQLVVAGETLNVELLQRFYARHGFAPVWASRPAQAGALLATVLRAGDQGLDPALFHATLLRQGMELSPTDRELLLSDAFLSYADALARGVVPVERRKDNLTLAPEPVDVAAVLDAAIASPDPGATIENLAPTTTVYWALRQALQNARAGAPAGARAATDRVRTIEVNLERQRWLPRDMPTDMVWVNIADERLVMYRAAQPVFTTRVVVGEDVEHNQSPEFHATIDASFYNPPWVIPSDIATAEILPKLGRDPAYLTRNKMVMLDNGDVEQLPGPDAGLGLIMFDMPNRFDVYLHDTPDRAVIFNRNNRRISHGCIRVQNPRELAALLMGQPIEEINEGIAAGGTTRNNLPAPIPVYVVYQTAFVDTAGALQFRPDFYNRDATLWRQLQTRSHPAVTATRAEVRPRTWQVTARDAAAPPQ